MSKLVRIRNKVPGAPGGDRAGNRNAKRSGRLPPASPPAAADEAQEQVRGIFDDSEGAGGPDDVDVSRPENVHDDVEALHDQPAGQPPEDAF